MSALWDGGRYVSSSASGRARNSLADRTPNCESDAMTARVVGMGWRFDHVGIPTSESFPGEIPVPHLKITVSDHLDNPVGVQWQRYDPDANLPDLVKTVAHVAFEVDDLESALEGQKVIIEPNSPSPGVIVAFIEVRGAPVELLQIDHTRRPELDASRGMG